MVPGMYVFLSVLIDLRSRKVLTTLLVLAEARVANSSCSTDTFTIPLLFKIAFIEVPTQLAMMPARWSGHIHNNGRKYSL